MEKSKKFSLYSKLETHFNEASRKYPDHAHTFEEALRTYKGALVDNDPLCRKVIESELESLSKTGEYVSARRPEVVETLKTALEIVRDNKSPKI